MTRIFLAAVAFSTLTIACAPPKGDTRDYDGLQARHGQLQAERDRLTKENADLGNRIDRMSRCNKHFNGYFGQRVEKEIRLVRVTQRVQRFDCDNKMTSDNKETVQSPSGIVELRGIPLIGDSTNTVSVYNRRTCAIPDKGFSKGGIVLAASRHPHLRVNRSNTLFDHEVEPGMNEIDLSICSGNQSYCKDATFVVTIALNVIYEEIHNDEVLVVKKTPEDCKLEAERKAAREKGN